MDPAATGCSTFQVRSVYTLPINALFAAAAWMYLKFYRDIDMSHRFDHGPDDHQQQYRVAAAASYHDYLQPK